MSIELLRALYRGEKQTLALIERECNLRDPEVRAARDQKQSQVEKLVKEINDKTR